MPVTQLSLFERKWLVKVLVMPSSTRLAWEFEAPDPMTAAVLMGQHLVKWNITPPTHQITVESIEPVS